MAHSFVSTTDHWMDFANSKEEYATKLKEKRTIAQQVRPIDDLISFYVLERQSQKLSEMNENEFNAMPDKYVADLKEVIGCSLPNEFSANAVPAQRSEKELNEDQALLASLLGNYNPPKNCNITALDKESIDTLSLPNTLQPIQKSTKK